MAVLALGPFDVLVRLGARETSNVFLARDLTSASSKRLCVIKVLFPALAANEHLRLMFHDEVKIARRLAHPNIVRHYYSDRRGGVDVLAMEYVFGADLARLQRAAFRTKQSLSLPVVLSVMAQLLTALHHAHELREINGAPLNLVHRDVTPRNLLIGYDGIPKLIDFGAARTSAQSWETASGVIVGSLSYASPEQLAGKKLDRRTDVFAAGIVLWEVLAGRPLFGGNTPGEVIEKMRTTEVPAPSEVAVSPMPGMIEVDRIVLKALDRSPRGRYETAEAMAVDLRRALVEISDPPSSVEIATELRLMFGREIANQEIALQTALNQRAGIQDLAQLLGCQCAEEHQIRAMMRG